MPLVELQEFFLVQELLDFKDYPYLPQAICNEIGAVAIEKRDWKCFLAFVFDKEVWGKECEEVVDNRPKVKMQFGHWHEFIFNSFNRFSIVLKAESLVLVMDQGLPAPDWEADLLPARNMKVMVFMFILFKDSCYFVKWSALIIESSELCKRFNVCFFVEWIMDVENRIVVLEEPKQHF